MNSTPPEKAHPPTIFREPRKPSNETSSEFKSELQIKKDKKIKKIKNTRKFSLRKPYKPLLIAAYILIESSTSGCTFVTIIDREGTARIEHSFGITKIELRPDKEAIVAEVAALGLYSGPIGSSLGYQHLSIASLPNADECRLIVWPKNISEIESIYMPLFPPHPSSTTLH